MKRLPWVLASLLLLGSPPAPVGAQQGRLWVEPRVGWSLPTRDLGRTDVLADAGYGVFERADLSWSLGVGAGVALTDVWALRLRVDRTTDASVEGEWLCAPFVACPSVILFLEGELDHWSGALDLLYRVAAPDRVGATLHAGVGVRRSELVWTAPPANVGIPTLDFRETSPILRLGVGVEVAVGATTTAFGEAGATVSRFGGGAYRSIEGSLPDEPRTAVDVGLVGGVRIFLR